MKSKILLVGTIFGLTNLATQTADKTFWDEWAAYKKCYRTCYYKSDSDPEEELKQRKDRHYDYVHGHGAAAKRDMDTNKKILSDCQQECLNFLPATRSDSYLRTLKKQAIEEGCQLDALEARAAAIIAGAEPRNRHALAAARRLDDARDHRAAIIPTKGQRWILRKAYESRNNK